MHYFLADKFVRNVAGNDLAKILETGNIQVEKVVFNGECSTSEIKRVTDLSKNAGSNVVIGISGGKTTDTAKAVANNLDLKLTTVPTTASTDAPTSGIKILI